MLRTAARRHEGVDILFERCVVYIEVAPDRNAFFEVVRPEVGVESAAFIYQGSDFRKGLADGLYFVKPALPFEHRTYKLIAAVYRGVGYDFPISARRMVVPFDFAEDTARADGVAELPLISVDDFKLDAEAAAENKTALSGEGDWRCIWRIRFGRIRIRLPIGGRLPFGFCPRQRGGASCPIS